MTERADTDHRVATRPIRAWSHVRRLIYLSLLRALRFCRQWQALIKLIVYPVAAALGLWGWYIFTQTVNAKAQTDLADWVENIFRTLQLLTFQFPHEFTTNLPWQLNVARFLLPLVVLFESYRLVVATIRARARLAGLGFRQDHVIAVVGNNATGRALLRQLAVNRPRAVAIVSDMKSDELARIEADNIAVLAADPRRVETWDQAHVHRAALIFVAQGNDLDNLNITATVADALHDRAPEQWPLLVAAIENDQLAAQVDSALDRATRASGLRYRRLSIPDEAARALFVDPLLTARKADRTEALHVLILGLGTGARAVLRQALTLGQDAAVPPCITVMAPDKELAAEKLLRNETIPPFVATIRTIGTDWADGLQAGALADAVTDTIAPTLIAVCLADDMAVAVAVAAAQEAAVLSWPAPVIAVHQQREDRFLSLLIRDAREPAHAWLRPFGGLLPDNTLARLHGERQDRLPRAVHAQYREQQTAGAHDTPPVWEDLPENERHSNRAAADHIPVKCAAIGAQIREGHGPAFAFTEEDIDLLARIEHRRWCAERLLGGWQLGARNKAARQHSDLVPFDELPTASQATTREAVLALPVILALAGQHITRPL